MSRKDVAGGVSGREPMLMFLVIAFQDLFVAGGFSAIVLIFSGEFLSGKFDACDKGESYEG